MLRLRRARATFLTGATVILMAANSASATAPPSLASPMIAPTPSLVPLTPQGAGLVHKWVALNQVPTESLSPQQVAVVANNFNLAVVKDSQAALVDQLKTANVTLTVLVYHNGAFAQSGQGTAFPADWYAHDAAHNKIIQPVWGNYLMDVSNSHWVDYVVQACRSAKSRAHADGCYTDMMMTAPLYPNYVTGRPINPATGRAWTFSAFQSAVNGIAARVRDEVSGPSAANGVGCGRTWFAALGHSSKTLTDNTDGSHAEIWLRDRTLLPTQFPTVAAWKQDVDMVVEAEAGNRRIMVETKLWEKGADQLSRDVVDRWRAFTLATFLLGTEGKSWYLFSPVRTIAGMLAADQWENVPVGTPKGPYVSANGVYMRSFLNGFAAVNPSATDSSVTLPTGTWRSLTGQLQSGTVSMTADRGMVWTRV